MSTYRVQWDQTAQGSKSTARKSTTLEAHTTMEAKAKVKQRLPMHLKITNMTAVKIH